MSRLLALIVLVGLVWAGLYYRREGGLGTPAAADATLAGVGSRLGAMGRTVGATLRDTTLTGKVKAAFELNRTVEPYDLDVAADGDSIVLRGEVPSPAVREAAGRIAADVPGVGAVRNELRVAEAGAPKPSEAGAAAPAAPPPNKTTPRAPSVQP